MFSGALLNLPISLSLSYESHKYLLVTLMVLNLHKKRPQNINKYLVRLVSFSHSLIFGM